MTDFIYVVCNGIPLEERGVPCDYRAAPTAVKDLEEILLSLRLIHKD